jgi:hypothetical protein
MAFDELEDDASVAVEESRDVRAGSVVHDCWSSLGIALCTFGTLMQVGFHRYSQFASWNYSQETQCEFYVLNPARVPL